MTAPFPTFLIGLGNDTVTGGQGADRMSGEGGSDVFLFRTTTESDTAGRHDTITDFVAGQDRISLAQIDGALDDFRFVGAAAFIGLGLLRLVASGGNTLVQVNTQGGLGAEIQISLQGVHVMSASDFLL